MNGSTKTNDNHFVLEEAENNDFNLIVKMNDFSQG
jgi:hypothetical protein